jgi:diphosphomevalonate decarboxylase
MPEPHKIESGSISWRSPSNIALVKYWGKKPVQLPANPSLSMTLSNAYTELILDYSLKNEEFPTAWLEFLFEGNKQENFEIKIAAYLRSLVPEFPVLNDYNYKISSSNTFPHSAGIASSASSMSALGLCLADFLSRISGELPSRISGELPSRFSGELPSRFSGELPSRFSGWSESFIHQASRLSRLASGSACRSVYGGFVVWGLVPELAGTSDDFAIPVPYDVNPAFKDLKDSIMVVSSREKEVSSRTGHSLMAGHPFAQARYIMAMSDVLDLSNALRSGDFEEFVRITETEALNLHALMMTSSPSYLLIEPNTLNIVNAVRLFRKETKIPVCFTLDAGPNVHLLYPEANANIVKTWINAELIKFCENGKWIDDGIGQGPERLHPEI